MRPQCDEACWVMTAVMGGAGGVFRHEHTAGFVDPGYLNRHDWK